MEKLRPSTLEALRPSSHRPQPVKQEVCGNLVRKLEAREPLFSGVLGYERPVIPGVVNALLARHDFIAVLRLPLAREPEARGRREPWTVCRGPAGPSPARPVFWYGPRPMPGAAAEKTGRTCCNDGGLSGASR